ncbi:AMP-binding protein [Candidatus Vondammii sp. HM_W22]|uniref:AMP-binding protein n=1 Tax=Candidatus Vondammii sp. HM_W22 TaxID=2687299 RepID=UPI001F149116|nr:AMP-binding protein [Candidatus Vondammii sp. HM_W22]
MRQFEKRFYLPIHESDGSTGCSPAICVNPIGCERKPASVGLPLPGVEIEILGEASYWLPADEIGELCVRGPNVMK